MAWIVEDRLKQYQPVRSEPYLTAELRADIEKKYFPRYPRKQAALLPLFHIIMHTYGYIAPQAIDEAAEFLGISRAEVQDAVTFYEEFRLQPSGRYVVNVCRSISCELCGHQAVLDKIRAVFGIDPGETTDDNKLTVLEVECLGACEQAPCALVNENLHGCIEPNAFAAQLRALPDHPAAGH
jgi:NADH-quinone oxidoreductase subunit E